MLAYRRPFHPLLLIRERKLEEPYIQPPLRNNNVEIHDFDENEQNNENMESHEMDWIGHHSEKKYLWINKIV